MDNIYNLESISKSVDLTELYGKLAGPWVSTLLGELLVLGFFFVIYNYIKLLINKLIPFNPNEILKRFILLGGVSLFVFYVDLTYFLEYEHIKFKSLVNRFRNLNAEELHQSKIILVSLVPIDLLTISSLTGMFATLSIEAFYDDNKRENNDNTSRIMLWLFFFAACFHLFSLLWWYISSVLAGSSLSIYDISFHGIYCLLHLGGYLIWRHYFNKEADNIYVIIYFFILLISVYVVRQWWYIDKLIN